MTLCLLYSGLTKTEVVSQGILFFIAGYETTATSIAFTMYNLALNLDFQEKLHEEIMDVAGNKVFFLDT